MQGAAQLASSALVVAFLRVTQRFSPQLFRVRVQLAVDRIGASVEALNDFDRRHLALFKQGAKFKGRACMEGGRNNASVLTRKLRVHVLRQWLREVRWH